MTIRVELTCPCCDRYCVVSNGEAFRLRQQQACSETEVDIICYSCWKKFIKVVKRRRKHRNKT